MTDIYLISPVYYAAALETDPEVRRACAGINRLTARHHNMGIQWRLRRELSYRAGMMMPREADMIQQGIDRMHQIVEADYQLLRWLNGYCLDTAQLLAARRGTFGRAYDARKAGRPAEADFWRQSERWLGDEYVRRPYSYVKTN